MRPVTTGLNNTVSKIPEIAAEIRIASSRDVKHTVLSIRKGFRKTRPTDLIMKTHWMTQMRMWGTNRVAPIREFSRSTR
jgi:hypothetical protein